MFVDRKDGMQKSELEVIQELVKKNKPQRMLEIGLANGSSSLALLEAAGEINQASLVSIDPFQNKALDETPAGYAGRGLKNIIDAGFKAQHTLIEEPSYLALPQLVRQQKKFDLILIDGYHAFDFALVDFFYADLLLNDSGLLLLHDTNLPTVFPVGNFILRDKSYQLIGPRMLASLSSFPAKALRRIKFILSGNYQEFCERRDCWQTLAAFRKKSSKISDQFQLYGVEASRSSL